MKTESDTTEEEDFKQFADQFAAVSAIWPSLGKKVRSQEAELRVIEMLARVYGNSYERKSIDKM